MTEHFNNMHDAITAKLACGDSVVIPTVDPSVGDRDAALEQLLSGESE